MPEISRFLGIVIAMFYNDHAPPHFHVKYNDFRASISLDSLEILEGSLPKRVQALVVEWARNIAKNSWKTGIWRRRSSLLRKLTL